MIWTRERTGPATCPNYQNFLELTNPAGPISPQIALSHPESAPLTSIDMISLEDRGQHSDAAVVLDSEEQKKTIAQLNEAHYDSTAADYDKSLHGQERAKRS